MPVSFRLLLSKLHREVPQSESGRRIEVNTDATTHEENRIAVAEANGAARKPQVSSIRTIAAQPHPKCSRCQRTSRDRIGLIGHLRTQYTNCPKTAPAPTSTSTTAAPTLTNVALTSRAAPLSTIITPAKSATVTAAATNTTTSITSANDWDTPDASTTTYTFNIAIPTPTMWTEFQTVLIVTSFSPCIALADHLRSYRTETGEPAPGAPTYTHRIRLHCLHSPRTFTQRMGLFDHVRIHDSGMNWNIDTSSTS
ncbi:hypothetical protein SprV_0100474300 [Sparganum proliferum]